MTDAHRDCRLRIAELEERLREATARIDVESRRVEKLRHALAPFSSKSETKLLSKFDRHRAAVALSETA